LFYTQLSGTLPVEALKKTDDLVTLDLKRTKLSGTLPGSAIQDLTDLALLDLSYVPISGSLPPQVGRLTDLKYFTMAGTSISGSLPSEVVRMKKLQQLTLSQTLLSGSVPPEFSIMDTLRSLDLSNAKLSGTVPEAISTLSKLSLFYIYGNKMTGTLPAALAGMGLSKCMLSGDSDTLTSGGSNIFACPIPAGIAEVCPDVQCGSPMSAGSIAAIAVPALLAVALLAFCGNRLRKHQIRKKTKLLAEVTTRSEQVMNDLADKKAGAPVVIVDGKSISSTEMADSSNGK